MGDAYEARMIAYALPRTSLGVSHAFSEAVLGDVYRLSSVFHLKSLGMTYDCLRHVMYISNTNFGFELGRQGADLADRLRGLHSK